MLAKTSQAEEDYLKAIYEITRRNGRASTTEIAEQLGVKPASATGMVQKLAGWQPPLLHYEKHRGVSLTADGEKIALEVIRHHRLLETYLLEKLGFTWDEVHEEADRLEHVISEALEDRIALVLGYPSLDPHGEPIPSRESEALEQSDLSLADLTPGDQAIVVRIHTSNPDLLRYLASIDMILNCRVTVMAVSPFDQNRDVRIEASGILHVFGPQIASSIFVQRDP